MNVASAAGAVTAILGALVTVVTVIINAPKVRAEASASRAESESTQVDTALNELKHYVTVVEDLRRRVDTLELDLRSERNRSYEQGRTIRAHERRIQLLEELLEANNIPVPE